MLVPQRVPLTPRLSSGHALSPSKGGRNTFFNRLFGGLALAVAAVGLLAFACRERASDPPPIVLIAVDTLRADHLGSYGDRRGLTPFLDQLAGRGVRFANAYAPSSWTSPSIASLFTSRFPSQHRVTTYQSKLADDEVTLAEVLASRGYESAGFSANFRLSAALGFGQGFADWRVFVPWQEGTAKVGGEVLRADSLAWLDERRAAAPRRPRLLYYQHMEPHAPYRPPPSFRRAAAPAPDSAAAEAANRKLLGGALSDITAEESVLLASLYEGEVAALDAELRALFAELGQRINLDEAIIVITADHGEEFGEHGLHGHGLTLFEEGVRVPLLIIAPGVPPGVVEQPVSLVDVAPTLLALIGAETEPRFEGRSLLPLLGRGLLDRWRSASAAADVLCELEPTGAPFDMRAHDAALVHDSLKLLRSPNPDAAPQLFDLATDPRERTPDPATDAAAKGALSAALARQLAALAPRAQPIPATVPLDDPTRERLRALGYQP